MARTGDIFPVLTPSWTILRTGSVISSLCFRKGKNWAAVDNFVQVHDEKRVCSRPSKRFSISGPERLFDRHSLFCQRRRVREPAPV